VTMPASLPTDLFLSAAVGLPLLGAIGLAVRPWRRALIHLIPWAALPALAAVGLLPDGSSTVFHWVVLQTRLGLDPTGRLFLLFTSALWLLSGLFGASYLREDRQRARFFFFYGLAMSGNLGAILAQDMVSFYVFFALMSFSSYGLVVHSAEPDAVRAGRIYLYLVVAGEIFIFVALAMLAAGGASLDLIDLNRKGMPSNEILVLMWAGFGIKAGALPLHVWLPPAHSAAPTPASAVLSGAMIKVGLLGWLRFIPMDASALPAWGAVFVAAGIAAAFYGVVVGAAQSHPKTILAYSSISQMGLITVGFGASFWDPAAAALTLPAVSLYAIHHGLAKGALFLGVGILYSTGAGSRAFKIAQAGLWFAALSLAGAPFTSGAVSKAALQSAVGLVPSTWQAVLAISLPLASIATTLLMGRLVYVLANARPAHTPLRPGMWLAWLPMLAMVAATLFLLPSAEGAEALSSEAIGSSLWPLAAGAILTALIWAAARTRCAPSLPVLPSGDVVVIYAAAWRACIWIAAAARAALSVQVPGGGTMAAVLKRAAAGVLSVESALGTRRISGLVFLLLVFSFLLIFLSNMMSG
jgi:formate hydrogenlyase subunit 3/multisubunit Na+/H+ antiporter MnhD subunit